MVDFNVGVVVAAAGSGTRLGGSVPKQYHRILDKPLMFYPLETFLDNLWVTRVALVVDNVEKVKAMLQECGCSNIQKVTVVKGENTRHRSIRAGLLELHKQFADELRVVVVHDGVRPLVPHSLLRELVLGADKHGAAGAVRPLVSTVLRSGQDGFLVDSLDRSLHVASETPQAFQLSVLLSAYNKCSEEDLDHGTECLHLTLKHCGIKAKLVQGSEDLWKVTHRKDLLLATTAIKQKGNNVCIIAAEKTAVISQLLDSVGSVANAVRHIVSTVCSSDVDNLTYNTVIVFHEQEIQQDTHLVDFASMLDTDKLGLIIHVIDNASVEGMQGMSVYNLQRSGRSMAHHYEKLRKGVVIIHCISGSDDTQLVDLLTTLVKADPQTFSGQTLFI
ncbi:D-ribitol-5-phosphate cytidylyltransferase-like isoform X1 [Homalodisca vitripennis]|uniref:D-ribitol-5-phosphate cytidylyltransferase-like isoform X1 n=1 Tax=Homalodisca vitripennis TaxID=197043 RepID=UPI001EEACD15|nr:D-ribitol-5-phosphate cytidylyltransferase-like isoform X1 [Homalodisca vitripennis]